MRIGQIENLGCLIQIENLNHLIKRVKKAIKLGVRFDQAIAYASVPVEGPTSLKKLKKLDAAVDLTGLAITSKRFHNVGGMITESNFPHLSSIENVHKYKEAYYSGVNVMMGYIGLDEDQIREYCYVGTHTLPETLEMLEEHHNTLWNKLIG